MRLILILALLEGVFVVWNLLMAPSEAQAIILMNYSFARLVLLSGVLAVLLAVLYLLVQSFRVNWFDQGLGKSLDNALDGSGIFWSLLAWGGVMYFLVFASAQKLGGFASYRERLFPILIWFALISIQTITGFICLRSSRSRIFQVHRESIISSGVVLGLFVFSIIFISLTKIGLSPDPIYWQGPGVPVMASQVFMALLIGLLFKFVLFRFGALSRAGGNLGVCISLWILAAFLWWSQPARTSYNSLAPSYPNFQSYPFGDAILYDTVAHEFLTGTAMPGDFWVKPLYSLFLAFLHVLAGENYQLLVLLQIVILALIPVLVYLLVSLIGNRPAGIVASLLVILRERNALALSNVIQVSHLKLLLSDLFSMGLVALLLLLLFQWFDKSKDRRDIPMILGGVFGLLVLTRGHPVILFPIILAIIFLFKLKSFVPRWQSAVLFTLGTALTLIPWAWRIYETTGRLAIQSPVSNYTIQLAEIYSLTPNLPDPGAFATNTSLQNLPEYDLLRKQTFDFVIQNPDEVLRFVSAHYFHNAIHSYIYLPQSLRIESLRSYVTTEPFWDSWEGAISAQGWVLLCLNILLISLGIGSAWRKHGFPALVPLLIGMGYNASVSFGRISGWRFILPVDWITLIYLSIGLIQVADMVGFLLNRIPQNDSLSDDHQLQIDKILPRWFRIFGFAVLFLSIGVAVTYGNNIFSGRYPAKPAQQLVAEYLAITQSVKSPFSENELNEFIKNGRGKVVYGQAIYPYFMKENSGTVNHYWPAYKPRPYNRFVFYLVGPESLNVVLSIPSSDYVFPDGADVIVIGCSDEKGDMDAISVLIKGDSPIIYTRDLLPALVCPLP